MTTLKDEEEDANITLQKEELEALSAIYGEDFQLEQDYDEDWLYSGDKDDGKDAASKKDGFSVMPTFSIVIKPNNSTEEEEGESATVLKKKDNIYGSEEARLIISFQPGYPTLCPPIYQLSIPWLRGGQKQVVAQALEELYLENLGESVVYIWVEKLREELELLTQRSFAGESKSGENKKKVDPSGGNNSCASASDASAVPSDEKVLDSTSGEKEKLIEHFTASLSFNHSLIRDDDGETPSWSNDLYEAQRQQQFQSKHNQIREQQHHQRDSPSNKIEIQTGAPLTDRKSTFQAHVAPIMEVSDVRLVLNELYQNKKIAAATHNMYAYRILKRDGKTCLQDCDDDGETHAGSRLLHLLQILDCKNVLVVVSRWYGGIQLHADRFKHINNVARQALSEFGFLSGTDGKKAAGGGTAAAAEESKSRKTAFTSSNKK